MDCIFCQIVDGKIPSDIVYQDEEVIAFRDINPVELARKEGIAESGYRLVINSGEQGGQLVPHLHMHLLGGRRLSDAIG